MTAPTPTAPAHGPMTERAPARFGEEVRALLTLALPLAFANLVQMAIYVTDVLFIARLGERALASATLAVNLLMVGNQFIMGVVSACAPLIAATLGAHRHAVRDVRRSVRMALWLATLLCLPVWALLAASPLWFALMGQDAGVSADASLFLKVVMVGIWPASLFVVMRQTVSALERPTWGLWATILMLVVNLVGNYMLVFGHWGAPALGLTGSAIASVLAHLSGCLMLGAVLLGHRHFRRYHLFGRWWRPDWLRTLRLLHVGIPIAMTVLFETAVFAAAAFLMGRIGVTDVAAHAIALQIAALAFMVPLGVSQAATIRVGYAYGAGDRRWIARAGHAALLVGIGFMALTAMLFWIAPAWPIAAYVDTADPANAALVAKAAAFITIAGVFQLADGAQVVGAGLLRGLQDTKVPMLFAAFGYWVLGFGTAVALGLYSPLAGRGVWMGLALGLMIVALLMIHRWHNREKLGLTPTFH